MRRSNRLSLSILAFALGLLPVALFSQSITYQNPPEFFACDEAVFSFTVQNTGGSALTNGTVTVNFTTTNGTACGIQYVVGSVSAPVAQGNVSNLSAPQFSLPTLAAGASQSFTIKAKADCQTAACIDNAEVFVNSITLNWSGGNTSVTTNPYVVDRALLLFTNVSNTVMSGSRDEVLQRKLTIRNTRPGAVSEFILRDVYQPGISITSAQGTVLPSAPGSFALRLDGSDFAAIGDGDDLFEFNETIIVTEDILIESCGVDETSATSDISVAWGCGGDTCQLEHVTAVVVLEQYKKVPQLAFEPLIQVPDCFCGPNGIPQGLKITNAGDGMALNVHLEIQVPNQSPRVSLDPASIRLDSSGTNLGFIFNSQGGGSFFLPYCDAPLGLIGRFSVDGFSLAPGESVTLHWNNYFCSTGCTVPTTNWRYKYSYYKQCPPNIFVQNSEFITVKETGVSLSSLAELEEVAIVQDGETHTGVYTVIHDSLSLLDGTLTVDMAVPCGLELVPGNPFLLNGQAPLGIEEVATDTFIYLTATYQLPLNSDTGHIEFDFVFRCDEICRGKPVCDYELVTTCTNSCFGQPPPTLSISITTTLDQCGDYPSECNIQSCTDLIVAYECESDSLCLDEPPGYLRYDFEALRKNYGLPDNNNDRYADAPTGLPNMALVERRRFLPGDTVQTTIRGIVMIDKPGATLPYGEMTIAFFPDFNMTTATRDSLLIPGRFTSAGSRLRVFDSSTGTWYECLNPPATTSGFINFKYNLSLLKGSCLPANFAFDQGDSIVFVGNYRIGFNPMRENSITDTDPLTGNIKTASSLILYDDEHGQYTDVSCNCEEEKLLLAYYEYTIQPQTIPLPPCDTSQYSTLLNIKIDLQQGNMFPFEHRNLLVMEDLRMLVPPSVQLLTTRLLSLRFQNGGSLVSQIFTTPPFANGVYFNNMLPYQAFPVDEGFAANFQFIFDGACDNKFSMPITYSTKLNWAPGLPEPEDPEEYALTHSSLRPLIANLSIEAMPLNIVSYSDRLEFDFLLKNTPTLTGNFSSGPAPNTWLYVTSQTGLVTDFQLIDSTTGQLVPLVNGLFQLGNLPVNPDGFPYRLLGINNSCERERLLIHYGWNCDQLQSTVQTPCYQQTLPLFLESPPGELDMLVTSPTGCSQLCDTIPYHSIQVFNADFGSVYNLRLKALLPPGMSVITGSTVVEYPTGSGTLYPIGDPTIISTGVVEWNLSMLFDSIAVGLPGVGEAPYNSLTLKFLGESTCDFVADAYSLFIAAAEQNCGTPTNSIAKPGTPVCIDGVTMPYSTNITVTPTPGFGCNNITSFEVSLASSAVLPQGACLIATLPPGITYVPGSCQNLCTTNLDCTPTINGSQITWQLPTGVLPTQLVCFQFNTQGWASLGCENGVVLFRSAAETQALCALTGDSCSTKVSTGSLIVPFDPQRPDYDLGNFTITATASGATDQVSVSVDVTNNGAVSLPPTIVQFFADTDGDGDGDQLLFTQNYNLPIASGQTVAVTGSFSVPAAMNLCRLLAVIDASQQCACGGDVEPVSAPVEYNTGLAWTVCSNTDQLIGIPALAGFDYQWSPDNECIGDPQGATTNFNCENDGILPETFQFTLTESNGFCVIENALSVTVQPVPGIAFADSPICIGESANLAATDGVAFNWQGPGIAQPNQQIVTVTPASTSNYSVTVTDAFGCSGTDVTTVVVSSPPSVNAGPDAAFCPGEMPQLNANFNPDWDYLWSPQIVNGQTALSDPTIHNPLVLVGETTTFTLSVLDGGGCSGTDAVTVSFADSLVLNMPSDVTICTGGSATLTVTSNVPATFSWSPNGTCLDPPSCSSLLVTPSSTTTYIVNAVGADGCPAMGSVTVTVVSDVILTNGPPIEICTGETVVINGQTVSQPGIYCDTISLAGGCDSVYCVELTVNPGIDSTFIDTMICLGASVVFEGQTYFDEGQHCITFPGQNGCDSVRCLVLAVEDLGIQTTIDSVICQGDSVFFEGQFYTTAGEYCVAYSTPDGCDSLSCLNLVVNDIPIIEIMGADTVASGDTLVLELNLVGPFGSILWYANDSLLADCTGELSCLVSPTDSVVYTVQVTTLDTGCPGTDSLAVTVIPDCKPKEVGVPNAFSPNGDQMNDVFDIVGPGAEEVLNMRIWNRWGQKVYDGPGPWDGKQNGKDAPSDVYIYLIKVGCAVFVEDMEEEFKGDVTLLR